jgi:hypothetical protein
MTPKRPTALTVMGILNIVFGSLGLVCSLCAGIGYLFMLSNSPLLNLKAGGVNVNPFTDQWEFMKREVPGYPAFMIGGLVEGLIGGTLLLIAGIGLLKVQSWGRVLSLLYALLTIVAQIFSLIFTLAYVNPAMQRWQQDFVRRFGGQLPPGGGLGEDSMFNNAIAVGGAVVGVAYAVVLIIMMMLPHVREAFAGTPPPMPLELGREDEGGDEYERQRRSPWDY